MRLSWPNMIHVLWFEHNVALELGIFVASLHSKVDGFRAGVRLDVA